MSEVRFCMMAQMSLVSLAVKVAVASLLEVVELVVWSMLAMMCFCGSCLAMFFLAVVEDCLCREGRSCFEVSLFHMTAHGSLSQVRRSEG